ncbi:hypothetical protein [Lawsonia intracellularis]|nr:hypothetical protein [Lawsonia intracellularis]
MPGPQKAQEDSCAFYFLSTETALYKNLLRRCSSSSSSSSSSQNSL